MEGPPETDRRKGLRLNFDSVRTWDEHVADVRKMWPVGKQMEDVTIVVVDNQEILDAIRKVIVERDELRKRISLLE